MKTSVIHVHEMLSVWSVDEIEKRIGEVPGVESVTLNFAAGSATVRYDETRLEVGDIKSAVRQRSYESVEAAPSPVKTGEKKKEQLPIPSAAKPSEAKDNTKSKPTAITDDPNVPPPSSKIEKPVKDKAPTEPASIRREPRPRP